MKLNDIDPQVLFEQATPGAFGMGTKPPKGVDKRPMGRWDPLSGDKFIKSKVGKAFHTPIPKTPTIDIFKGEDITAETVEEMLGEHNCSLFETITDSDELDSLNTFASKAGKFMNNEIITEETENVEEVGILTRAAVKMKRMDNKDAPWMTDNVQKNVNRQEIAAGHGGLTRQKELFKAEPRLRKSKYQTMVKHPTTGNMTPSLSPKGHEVVKRWDRQATGPNQ